MNERTRVVLRRRLVVAAIIVAALAVCFVAALYGPRILLHGELSSDSARARAESLPTGDQAHAKWRAIVAPALGLPGEPLWSATYDVCWTDHSDSGWMIQNWNRNCLLNRIDLYAVPSANRAVDSLLKQAQVEGAGSSQGVWADDYLAAAGVAIDEDEIPATMPDTVWVTPPGVMDARTAADMGVIADAVVTYAMEDAFQNRELLTQAGNPDLDPNTPYLMLSDPQIYYERNIGCAMWPPALCSSPLGEDE